MHGRRSHRRHQHRQRHPEPDVIELKSGCTYTLTARDNYWYGPNALPPIESNITIDGTAQGTDTLQTTPSFQVFSFRFEAP